MYSGDYAEEICPQDDTDGDGTPDIFDSDIDDDGVANDDDDFPYDRNETIDSDLDGIGNNADDDDDGDGVLDINDECPETKILYAPTGYCNSSSSCLSAASDIVAESPNPFSIVNAKISSLSSPNPFASISFFSEFNSSRAS